MYQKHKAYNCVEVFTVAQRMEWERSLLFQLLLNCQLSLPALAGGHSQSQGRAHLLFHLRPPGHLPFLGSQRAVDSPSSCCSAFSAWQHINWSITAVCPHKTPSSQEQESEASPPYLGAHHILGVTCHLVLTCEHTPSLVSPIVPSLPMSTPHSWCHRPPAFPSPLPVPVPTCVLHVHFPTVILSLFGISVWPLVPLVNSFVIKPQGPIDSSSEPYTPRVPSPPLQWTLTPLCWDSVTLSYNCQFALSSCLILDGRGEDCHLFLRTPAVCRPRNLVNTHRSGLICPGASKSHLHRMLFILWCHDCIYQESWITFVWLGHWGSLHRHSRTRSGQKKKDCVNLFL